MPVKRIVVIDAGLAGGEGLHRLGFDGVIDLIGAERSDKPDCHRTKSRCTPTVQN